jgi:hypothetical protein
MGTVHSNAFNSHPTRRIDGRGRTGRRRSAIARALEAELGAEATEGERFGIARAASLLCLAEECTAKRLAGDLTISIDEIIRLSGEARRALRDLGLRAPGDDDPEPDPWATRGAIVDPKDQPA